MEYQVSLGIWRDVFNAAKLEFLRLIAWSCSTKSQLVLLLDTRLEWSHVMSSLLRPGNRQGAYWCITFLKARHNKDKFGRETSESCVLNIEIPEESRARDGRVWVWVWGWGLELEKAEAWLDEGEGEGEGLGVSSSENRKCKRLEALAFSREKQ